MRTKREISDEREVIAYAAFRADQRGEPMTVYRNPANGLLYFTTDAEWKAGGASFRGMEFVQTVSTE